MSERHTMYPNVTEQDGPVIVMRDGVAVSPVLEHQDTAFAWLLRHQGQSVSYALTYGGYAVEHAYSASELEALPTLAVGQADNLKVDNGDGTRVWLSRITTEDGMEYDNQVTVERYIDGQWVTVAEYAG